MKTMPSDELAAVTGGSPALPTYLDFPSVGDPRSVEEFLAWWFQQTLLQ